jgi:hypothetical protein
MTSPVRERRSSPGHRKPARGTADRMDLLRLMISLGTLLTLLFIGIPSLLAPEPDVMVAPAAPDVRGENRAAGNLGLAGASYAGTGTPTGTKRGESLLWWNDGIWWANMWDRVTEDFYIFQLEPESQTWVRTTTAVDWRPNTHADALWTGTKLYIASHRFVDDKAAAQPGHSSFLFRYSYDPAAKRYSLDAGFPNEINTYGTESLVVDRDSTGVLWATWQQNGIIYVNRTLGPSDEWGTPFPMPGGDVTLDDTSAVLAIGNRMFVMWSDQSTTGTGMYYSLHVDGAPWEAWSPKRAAISGPRIADDHINLKWLDGRGGGQIFAVVKTSLTAPADPLVMLLVYDVATDSWSKYPIAAVADCPNRVIGLIDEENRILHTYGTYPVGPDGFCGPLGGAIHRKSTSLDSISFPPGSGTPVITSPTGTVRGVSSTKQNVDAGWGVALIADNPDALQYWTAYRPAAR